MTSRAKPTPNTKAAHTLRRRAAPNACRYLTIAIAVGLPVLAEVTNAVPTAPSPVAAQSVSEQDRVRTLQEALNELGYSAGPEDGIYGPKTRDAIETFQRDRDMAITGQPSAVVLDAVRSALRQQTPADERDTATRPGAPESQIGETQGRPTAGAPDQVPEEETDPTKGSPEPSAAPSDNQPQANSERTGSSSGSASDTAPNTDVLVGTRWRFVDENGSQFVIRFKANNEVSAPTIAGDWTWRVADGDLVIRYEAGPDMHTKRRAPWPASNTEMTGQAKSSTGAEWSWRAKRLDTSSGPAS